MLFRKAHEENNDDEIKELPYFTLSKIQSNVDKNDNRQQ
jgi:hypothetical protein